MTKEQKNSYFFSDAHLITGGYDQLPERNRAVVDFLRFVKEDGERLFIVGDLFDFWFEYKHVIPKADPRVLGALADLVDSGVEVHYAAGNHDLWLGDYLRENIGIITHDDEIEIEIAGKKFYIAHGDGLYAKDRGYRIMKALFRNRLANFAFRWLHPDLGAKLARISSDTSRENPISDVSNGDRRDALRIFASRKIADGFNFVVFGHLHEPDVIKETGGTYINLGDWMHNFTYGKFDNHDMTLCYWENKSTDGT